jgi:cellulose synthase/poly-beta-1,6-N-acetylglucosamine synthase-like glycosyltransferase
MSMFPLQLSFWLAMFLIFWTYFGYFLLLWILSFFYSRGSKKDEFTPRVSLIIAAHNEEKRIREKLENSMSLSYPKGKLEIIVVSDASNDRTEEIVGSFKEKGIQSISTAERKGKHYAQKRGIEMATGEIMVLTDASTFLQGDAIQKIVRNFSDASIGCVSGRDRVRSSGSRLQGEGFYVRYEMELRALESRLGSLVGASGSFYAVRKSLCQRWYSEFASDFYLPIISYMSGYRTVLEPEAIGYYEVLKDPQKEFQRKVRTVVRGLEVLFKFKGIMNPFKYGTYSFQMISHKLSRWLVPIYLIFLFGLNLLLLDRGIFFRMLFVFQVLFYLLASTAFLVRRLQDIMLFKIPFFFIVVNLSILVAWYNFLIGKRFVIWEPSKR